MGDPSTGLGEFLRTRRARLSPEQVGVPSYGARRVPGLRREELAQLAGVSATYYTRLEQGQSTNASESVLEALAGALRLDDDERLHLFDLARPAPRRRRRPERPERPRPGIVALIGAMAGVPALVLGRHNDVLAWNALAHALLADHVSFDAPTRAGERPNLTRMLFLDPHHRALHLSWEEEASRAVASLRLYAGRHADERRLAELVGELTLHDPDFARLWAQHPVRACTSGTKYLRHPLVGDLEVDFEALHLPEDNGQRLLTYTTAPGSTSATGVQLLASLSAPAAGPSPRRPAEWEVPGRAQ